MAWTSPRTWVTGETVSASQLNAHVRDNMLQTVPALLTTAGDIVQATAANAGARLGIGTSGQVPQVNPGKTALVYVGGATVLDRDLTQVEVASSLNETSIYSHSIPANAMGTNGGLRLTIGGTYLNNTGGTKTLIFRIKLGATTILTSVPMIIEQDTTIRRRWLMNVLLMNSATDAQKILADFFLSTVGPTQDFKVQNTSSTSGRTAGVGYNTATEDTTGALTLDVTVQHSASDAALVIRMEMALLELIGAS